MGAGVIASFTYNRIMVNVSQGTMQKLRDDLFRKMESLPIKYFDTHAHGDIMSVYTNDVDTLRQLLSQSIPQIINSMISMAATLVTMLLVTSNFSKLSGRYYIRQQQDLGAVDGFIEEMLDGQKVVKVFCHEEAAKADFRQVNDRLRESANMANWYSNLLMPINANIGWVSYVLVAIIGAVLAINGMAGVSLGTVVTFVGLNKSFTNPISQVSMQINFIVTAAAVPMCGPGSIPTGRKEPLPIPGWRAAWCWTMWISDTTRKNWSSTTSACGQNRGRKSRLWAPPARARPPLPT